MIYWADGDVEAGMLFNEGGLRERLEEYLRAKLIAGSNC